MLVYRVEDNGGKGMYDAGHDFLHTYCPFNNIDHPLPEEDKLLQMNLNGRSEDSDRFGFKDLPQLNKWLYTKEVKLNLKIEGFKISVYECESVFMGDSQVIFDRTNAKLINKLELV